MSKQFKYEADGQLQLGQPAPKFYLPGVDGKHHKLEEFRGKTKALAVIFWCNHCPYVIKSEDKMISIYRDYENREVEFVLISANDVVNYPQDSFENMKKRSNVKEYPFLYLYNENQKVAKEYGALVTPHVFLFDADLILRYRGGIDNNINMERIKTSHYFRAALDRVLDDEGHKIQDNKTKAIGCSIKWK